MNKRLQCILSHIPDGIGVIDVGTDHGYLPVALAQGAYSGRLFASDLRTGPLAAARQSARAAGVEDQIVFLLCDGLDDVDPASIDTIVIAGMGGDTICGILDRAEWCMDPRYTFVFQPMTRAEVLRYWLVYNEFAIEEEDLVEDGGYVYSVFTARFGGHSELSDAELFTGSADLLRDHRLFPLFCEHLRRRLENMLSGLEHANAPERQGRIGILHTILKELGEMMPYDDNRTDL